MAFVSAVFDSSVEEYPSKKKVFKATINPFVFVGKAYNQNMDSHSLYVLIYSVVAMNQSSYSCTTDDVEQGEKIRQHYRNKLLLYSLKNIPRSSFQERLYELLENWSEFTEDDIRIFAKLPQFYDEDQKVKLLTKNCDSFDAPYYGQGEPVTLNDTLEYVGMFNSRSRAGVHDNYYWKDSKNRIVTASVRQTQELSVAWNFLTHIPRIRIDGVVYVVRHLGTDLFVGKIRANTVTLTPIATENNIN